MLRNLTRSRLSIAATAASAAAVFVAFTGTASAQSGAYNFVSAPRLHPPILHSDGPVAHKQLAAGDFLLANFHNPALSKPLVGQVGPLLVNQNLQPLWFYPVPAGLSATDLTAQRYHGHPVLSWWQGSISATGNTTQGTDLVVNQQYRTVATLIGQQGWTLSPHEFLINGNDAWVTAYKPVPTDLSQYGGATNGYLLDSAVQEYDLRNGKLLYTWDVKDHVPLSDSYQPAPKVARVPWDAYHINSIQLIGKRFLTSMRNTWAAYLIDDASQTIVWNLGGKRSSFKIPPSAQFQWQHHVILHSNDLVSIFDNHCCAIAGAGKFAPASGPSRGLELRLNNSNHTASLVTQYRHGGTFGNTAFLGSTQLLPNGNVLEGWGSQPYFSEYSRSGKLLLEGVFPGAGADISYRVFVQSWTGTPAFSPSGAARSSHGKVTVYASWDGATEVTAWRVLAGTNPKHLLIVAAGTKNGFETSVRLAKSYKLYKVQALGARGRVLRTSGAFSVPAAKPKSGGSGGSKPPAVCFYTCPA
jgi:Arylsulfotransferase (ASST)